LQSAPSCSVREFRDGWCPDCVVLAAGASVVRLDGRSSTADGQCGGRALLRLAAGPFVADCWNRDNRDRDAGRQAR
jgi:hypothetical protein